ncbi:hypothetical protein [Sedimentibacter sp. MB31-C6]|uniref:hypothetical protein n=1 Tax=Sedimentibacter sp. MB31-C6 TaxID=3109366 RepID=UPI002DDD0679|nr:hypothetical protein [Sedimentibacter sp. MB36-C1]WSI03179.1 hypothetical protein U8307_09000 [Sedimentibacter sp. MB36-C1]
MELNNGMFAIKLHELNQQYGHLQSRILLCQNRNHNKIRQEIIKIKKESEENDLLLQNRIDYSRSQAVSELAAAQMDYSKRAKEILEKDSLCSYESAALYAEYAIDFATQAMRNALLASFCAIDLQLTEEEKNKKRSENNE